LKKCDQRHRFELERRSKLRTRPERSSKRPSLESRINRWMSRFTEFGGSYGSRKFRESGERGLMRGPAQRSVLSAEPFSVRWWPVQDVEKTRNIADSMSQSLCRLGRALVLEPAHSSAWRFRIMKQCLAGPVDRAIAE